MPELLNCTMVAGRLKVSTAQVRMLIREGKLVGEKVGKQWVIPTASLEHFIKQNRFPIAPDDHMATAGPTEGIAALSFFSGAGGLDIGLRSVGVRPALLCEVDKACRLSLSHNCPDAALIGDIEAYDGKAVLEMAGLIGQQGVDLMFGGPPCQAFSTAGKRKSFSDSRGNVFLKYLELISEIRPKYAVFENVRGLMSAAYFPVDKDLTPLSEEPISGGALLYVTRYLERIGYSVSFELYNAANFGAPQSRERLVIIACRDGGKVPYLTPTHCDGGGFGLPAWRTLGDAFKMLREGVEHHFVEFPEARLKYYRMLKEGENWRKLPASLQREALGKSYDLGGGKTGFFRRLSFAKPSPTLVTQPNMPATDLAHPLLDRPLSVEEYKVIQEFPDDWVICGSISDQYRQIGNAVPVKLGEAIGKAVLAHMAGEKPTVFKGFKYSRYKRTSDVEWLEDMERKLQKLKFPPAQCRML